MGKISFNTELRDKTKKTHLIDYSCAKFGVLLKGIEGEYISVGCQLIRTGDFGSEYGVLEISWSATNLRLADGSGPPYYTFIKGRGRADIKVINKKGEAKKLKIFANVPKTPQEA